jgi:hypothetical protein
MSIKTFLHEIEAKLQAGNATEHTYRAALEALFNTVLPPAQATNEPKRASYGAPDFIIQEHTTLVGHAEAKDIEDWDDMSRMERPKPSLAATARW